MSPGVIAALVCLGSAALEGLMAGGGVRKRFGELRLPRYSPSFVLWLAIGLLYYALCFILLRHLVMSARFTGSHGCAFALLALVLFLNCFWNLLFFRLRMLRGSFLLFIPYGIVVVALVGLLVSLYPFGAALLASYCLYLAYAAHWAYRLWRLNEPNA